MLLFMLAATSSAAFKDSGWSPRAQGQGGAFTSADDDASVVFYNPAGLAFLSQYEIGLMYDKPFMGLDGVALEKKYAVYCLPIRNSGTITFAWTDYTANNIYREDAYYLSYAFDATPFLPSLETRRTSLAVGVNGKYLMHQYELDARTYNDPVFKRDRSKGDFSADFGLLLHKELQDSSSINAGLSLRNIVQPDLGLAQADIVPLETRLGANYYTSVLRGVYCANIAVDVAQRDKETNYHFGGECWLVPAFGLRAGFNANELAFGLSGDLTLSTFDLRLDYTFLWPLYIMETSGSHQIAFVVRF